MHIYNLSLNSLFKWLHVLEQLSIHTTIITFTPHIHSGTYTWHLAVISQAHRSLGKNIAGGGSAPPLGDDVISQDARRAHINTHTQFRHNINDKRQICNK